jgi:beta-arrestin
MEYFKIVYLTFNSDLVAELPFILMHPKPDDDDPIIGSERSPSKLNEGRNSIGGRSDKEAGGDARTSKDDVPNLIQLDG